jgi:hypothetical protein
MEPPWWRGEDATHLSAAAIETLPPTPARRRKEVRQGDLFFKPHRADADRRAPSEAAVRLAWLDSLFASEIYVAQRRLAGRGVPEDDLVSRILTALAMRGGRMTRAGLSQALEIPIFRLGGLVSATRRVLNVDQAQILRDDGDDVVLDLALLRAQFAIGDEQ